MTSLVPRPTSAAQTRGAFALDGETRIVAPESLGGVAVQLQNALRPATGLPFRESDGADRAIVLGLDPALAAEAYRLEVTGDAIVLQGGDAAGVFHGVQTLLQLLPPAIFREARVDGIEWSVPAITIVDRPRFGWRGAMLDVSRHFLPKREVLRFLDLMALHKLNVLHWHLADDQGWRIQIQRYPRLTEVGSWRRESQVGSGPDATWDGRPHGGFFSQDDIREVVAYAAARHIAVVPEIDVPGHSQAAIAAYPELGVTGRPLEVGTVWGIIDDVLNMEESTLDFYRNVFDEVMDLFPGTWIGVGGDECPRDQWRDDARTQELMRERGMTDEAELQTWFIRGLDDHITARGRRLFGWDEILEGELAPGATVASWRGMTGAVTAAKRGHDVVACPDDQVYLDYRQSEDPREPIPVSIPLTLADVYAFEPVPASLTDAEAAHVLGGQANVWSEHIDSPRTLDYLVFPRLAAVAEALWSGKERSFDDFEARLAGHLERLDALGVEYRHASGPRPWQERPGVPGRPATREERAAYIDSLVEGITV
ncbi:beta-N-acetylhexosaminidase [Frondihabitans cladoniiphilus]|uniref:beta-N-acetylhexosaminidase n=1 Tax=Frondihabitans cladoniiphilus TaxID=715785 RepID=A0ABP8VWC0_9MICO